MIMSAKKILLIEDNQDMAQLLALHLRDLQHHVELCFDGNKGNQQVTHYQYDLVILDLMLPGIDGLSICRTIRENHNYTPILMLTAKDSELDQVLGLETGADDYVTKPFSITEVIARIKAIFRRMDAMESIREDKTPDIIQRGMMSINLNNHSVTVSDCAIDLTAKEFDLLVFFARRPGRVFTRSELLDKVWGYGHDGYEHTVNSHINRLRVKIEGSPKQPVYIQTVWGVGYKFSEEQSHV
ncbi:MAG: response regulator transcription factor [Methylococcales bacterium]|nr:response regulator transcription factor [Methylococcales bacterium]